jgi:autotransporter-associated beta strand protein
MRKPLGSSTSFYLLAGLALLPAWGSSADALQLDLNGSNVQVDTLNSYSSVTNSGEDAAILTVGGTHSSSIFAGPIADGYSAVGLTKSGSGTLTLTGGNTFSSGTIAEAGTLIVGNAGALGSGPVSLDNGVALVFAGQMNFANSVALVAGAASLSTRADDVTLSGVVSGAGALTKLGAATLTLTGANTYSGGTALDAGAIVAGNAGALGSGAVSLADGVRLAFANSMTLANSVGFVGPSGARLDTGANDVTLSGAVSGAGALTKIGSGALTLTGVNTYAGGTVLDAGAIVAGNAGALGSGAVSLADGVRLGFANSMTFANAVGFVGSAGASLDTGANAVTLSGVVSGAGALTKVGSGALTLAGANTYAGGTFLDAGKLVIANEKALGFGALSMAENTSLGFTGVSNVTNRIIFAGAADRTIDTGSANVTLSGVVSGPGGMTKLGSGALVLSGADTYSGATLVSQGTLQVDGSIVSATTVAQGATLSGTGAVGSIAVLSGGALAPGNAQNPYGALRSTGNVSFAPGSTYFVALNPKAASLLSTTGSASVAGAVAATYTGAPPSNGARYTILTAAGGVKGTFSSVTTQGSGSNLPVLTYDANDVYLSYTGLSSAAVQASLQTLAGQRQGAMVTNQVLTSILGGVNEQINCSNCASGFGSIGSMSAGAHGRFSINQDLAMLGGAAFSQYKSGGVNVTSAPLALVALRYDRTEWGSSRPFAEVGVSASPWQKVTYSRAYNDVGTARVGVGSSTAFDYATFGKIGWLTRFSQKDEAAIHIGVSRNWQIVGGYTESGGNNPAPATIAAGTDLMNIASIGGQWTHLLGRHFELQFGIALEQSFASSCGVSGSVVGLTTSPVTCGEYRWADFGARVGYRIGNGLVADAFVDGTWGAQPIGNTIHGGLGLRYAL